MYFTKNVLKRYQIIPDFVLIVVKRYKNLNKKIAPRILLSKNSSLEFIFYIKSREISIKQILKALKNIGWRIQEYIIYMRKIILKNLGKEKLFYLIADVKIV